MDAIGAASGWGELPWPAAGEAGGAGEGDGGATMDCGAGGALALGQGAGGDCQQAWPADPDDAGLARGEACDPERRAPVAPAKTADLYHVAR